MDLTSALARFVRQLEADGRSRHTICQYQRHVLGLAAWLEETGRPTDLAQIDHEDLALFLVSDAARLRPDGKPKRTVAVNALRTSLRCFFGYIHAAGDAPRNAARLVRRAKCGPAPPRGLSEAEEAALFTALAAGKGAEAERDRALFELMLLTGVRLGDALGLEPADVDLEAGELTLRRTKGDRSQVAILPAGERAWWLRTYLAGREGVLFPGRDGRPISHRHAQRRLAHWCQAAGIERRVVPHELRHAFALRLYGSTGDLALVQAALGHRSILSTAIYARADRTRLRAALG